MLPVVLEPNRFPHFYRGGAAITRLRNVAAPAECSPEEWVGSATTRFGSSGYGLSRFKDGSLVKDALVSDPLAWLGPRHAETFGSDPGVLVKLLDAAERLPVHVHPTDDFARRHLGCRFGKTESWYVLDAVVDGAVYLGLKEKINRADLDAMVLSQDIEGLLGALRRFSVSPGDSVLVPAGMPHAIGEGVFVAETQQPTDFSIMLEQPAALMGSDLFCGLEMDVALSAVDLRPTSPYDIQALRAHVEPTLRSDTPLGVLCDAAEQYFRVRLLRPELEMELQQAFAVWIVLEGEGWVADEFGQRMSLAKGDTLVVPFACRGRLGGEIEIFSASPPLPSPRIPSSSPRPAPA